MKFVLLRFPLFTVQNFIKVELNILSCWNDGCKPQKLIYLLRFDFIPRHSFQAVLSSKKEFHMCLLIFPIIFNSIHSIFHASPNWAHVRFVNKNTNCETIQIVIYGDATLFRWHSFSFSIYLRFVGQKKYSP